MMNFFKLIRIPLIKSRQQIQLNDIQFKSLNNINIQVRRFHNDRTNETKPIHNFTELTNRKVLKVKGKDAFSYIQMLTTNNLQQNFNCLNSYLVNPTSKILCDLLIYKVKGDVFDKELILNGLTGDNYGKRFVDCIKESKENSQLIDDIQEYSDLNKDEEEIIYLECDAKLADSLRKTLFVRRLGQDVEFEILNDHKVYCVFPTIDELNKERSNAKFVMENEFVSNYFLCVNDPRLPYLGQRIITKLPRSNLNNLIRNEIFKYVDLKDVSIRDYRLNRFKLGVGEGLSEHRMAATNVNSFNGDFLNGIDLYKGGYLGSAIINRVLDRRHKYMRRLLPFKFINKTGKKINRLPTGLEMCKDDKTIGDLIDNVGDYGIGYFKMHSFVYIKNCRYIKVKLKYVHDDLEAIVKIPFWWPNFKDLKFLDYEEELLKFKEEHLIGKESDNLMLN